MNFTHRSIVTALLFSITFFFGCKEDDGGDGGEEIVGQELAGTWEQLEADDVTGPAAADFDGFSISISALSSGVSYTTNSGTHGNINVFPASGSFEVEASDNFESSAVILRTPDDIDVTTSISSDGQILNMSFTINTDGDSGGRYQGIDGQYQFTLTKVETN